ncbi:MAG: 2-oxo acid dehydrogenase subunit E2 [Firmicutes bacterium]|nr:2-oxo acid dehydrogenase subunit E2 [Bacillota bacterium]
MPLQPVLLPKTSDEVDESLIVFWDRQVGDEVHKGEVLVEIQTEKANIEIEAPCDGVLREIRAQRGDTVKVGDVLALIDTEAISSNEEQSPRSAPLANGPSDSAAAQGSGVQASPRVRRLVRELGIDIETVVGSGPHGRITEADVRSAAASAKVAPEASEGGEVETEGKLVPFSPIRQTIARRMLQSVQQTARLTETAWADITLLQQSRHSLVPQASLIDWILRAVVLALRQHPALNARWTQDGILQLEQVHIGVAVDTPEGLLVPVIHAADQLELAALSEAREQLVQRAKEHRLHAEEMAGGTCTVTNLGSYGVVFFTPILNPPETAIVGIGAAENQIVLKDGWIGQRTRLPLSLTFDHRVVDGAPAARFLQTLTQLLGNPTSLL